MTATSTSWAPIDAPAVPAEALPALMTRLGMTPTMFATLCAVSRRTLARWLLGVDAPTGLPADIVARAAACARRLPAGMSLDPALWSLTWPEDGRPLVRVLQDPTYGVAFVADFLAAAQTARRATTTAPQEPSAAQRARLQARLSSRPVR